MSTFVLAADVGGTKIAAARVDESGRLSCVREAPTPAAGGRAVVRALTSLLDSLPRAGVCAVGVDVPGWVRPDGRVWAPNIPGWRNMRLGAILGDHYRWPVVVDSDRNAFVTGEAWRGAARHCRNVVCLAVGTGIGAGIVANGQLVSGHAGLAGAVGWMAIRDRFQPRYKQVGCLEAHVAGPAIALAARRQLGRALQVQEVARLARAGHRHAGQLLREAGHALGLALANLVSTLNPEVIVLSGGVAGAGDALLSVARQTMWRWGQPLAVRQVRIVRSRLGAKAALLGIAKLAFDALEGRPKGGDSQ
jgi:glucokinase